MGLIHSVFCTITFCMERILTWACCSFVIIMLLFVIILLMIYGVTVGYSYAQKELAAFASASRSLYGNKLSRSPGPPSTPMRRRRRSGYDMPPADQTITEVPTTMDTPRKSILLAYRNRNAKERTSSQPAPVVIFPTERPPVEPEMQPHEKELARQLIGRFRRSKHISTFTTREPPLRPVTDISASPAISG